MALAMFTGVLTPVAAIGALLLNVNFVLSGIGNMTFDGPYMLAEILIVMAYPVVGVIGFQTLAQRILKAMIAKVRPARNAAPVAAEIAKIRDTRHKTRDTRQEINVSISCLFLSKEP